MDVLIKTKRENIAHKMRSYFDNPNIYYCWWRVHGKPRKCDKGDKIKFTFGERIVAESDIIGVVKGKIFFKPLTKVDKPLETNPINRGFKYI